MIYIKRGTMSNKNFSWLSPFTLSFCIYTIYCLTSVLRGLSAVTIQMPIVMLCFLLLLSSKHQINKGITLPVLAFIFILFDFFFIYLQGGMGNGDLQSEIGANFTIFNCMFPIMLVASGCFESCDKKKLYKIVLYITLLTCVTTIQGTFVYDYPCRELATPNNPDIDYVYKSKNIGGYGFVYYLLLLIPILVKKICEKYSLLDLIVLICSIFCVIRSEYTTALLIMFITGICLLFVISKSKFVKIGAVIFGIVCIFFLKDILIFAGSLVGDSFFVEQRINMLLDYGETGSTDGDMAERQDLYMLSFMSFLTNPVFGSFFNSGQHIGGHSEILDFLGHSGLIGVGVITLIYKKLKYNTPVGFINYRDPFVGVTVLVALFIAATNTFLSPELTFGVVVLPLLACSETDKNII